MEQIENNLEELLIDISFKFNKNRTNYITHCMGECFHEDAPFYPSTEEEKTYVFRIRQIYDMLNILRKKEFD